MKEKICYLFGHNFIGVRWENFLDSTNTGGNYIRNNGGRYTKLYCTRCNKVISLEISYHD